MIERVTVGIAGLGALLLASMLFRCVIAAQVSPRGASTDRVASIAAVPQPHAPVEEAGRSPTRGVGE